ncbi:MAG: hypothetical protein U0X39_14870 [Bacteroidales bacterium]
MDNYNSTADDLKSIRKIMEESSRFLSLSGLSGVFAGLFAIAGAAVAWFLILDNGSIKYDEHFRNVTGEGTSMLRLKLIADALVVLVLSVAIAVYFSVKRASKKGLSIWTPVTRRLLLNLMIPLVTGGLLIIILMFRNDLQLVVPGMLIFYGLALVNAGKFTFGEIFYLGLLEILTGLVSAVFTGYGIIFWIIGFGILHIVYGLLMYRKYES